jgi:hypothetical protein
MDGEATELRAAFVEAYPRYVAGLMGARHIEMGPVLADAVVEGTAVLDGLLASLERLAPSEQRNSPLELFREALRPVGHALDVAGVAPPSEPSGATSMAWDRHALSPGSSQVLGPRAHHAHLAWGVAKAREVAPMVLGPPVGVVWSGGERDRIVEILGSRGMRVIDDPAPDVVRMVVIETGSEATSGLIRAFASAGVHVIASGGGIDDLSAPGLRALGADVVVTTGSLLRDPDRYLPELA